MYFIYNKALNSFYGKGAVWVPKSVIKTDIYKLCVFGDMHEAKECRQEEAFKRMTMILNEKSLRNRLGIKEIPDDLKPNWNIHCSPSVPQESEPQKASLKDTTSVQALEEADDAESLVHMNHQNGIFDQGEKKMTYMEYLDQLESVRLVSSGDRVYLQSKLHENEDCSLLIQKTIRYLAETKKLLTQWSERMGTVEDNIHACDLKISDELHILELCTNLTDQDILQSAKRMQAIRRERRQAKNEKEVGHILLMTMTSGLDVEKIENLEKLIESQKDKAYRVRQPNTILQVAQRERTQFSPVFVNAQKEEAHA